MDSAIYKRYSTKSIPKLHKLAVEAFNAYIRERDRNGDFFYCPTCMRTKRIKNDKDGSNYQACHCFPADKFRVLEFNENNVFGGCKQCNYFRHGANYEYNDWVRIKIGDVEYQKLVDKKDYALRVGYKHDRFFLIDVIVTYREKIKTLGR